MINITRWPVKAHLSQSNGYLSNLCTWNVFMCMILDSYNVQMNYCCSIFDPTTVNDRILPHKIYLLPVPRWYADDVMLDFDIKHYIQADSGLRFFVLIEFRICRMYLPGTNGTHRPQCPVKWLCNLSLIDSLRFLMYSNSCDAFKIN